MNVSAATLDLLGGLGKNPPRSPLVKGGRESSGAVGKDLRKLRQATGQVVGSVFFGTLLKTMRESKLRGSIGHGGRGEEVFSAQLHGMWAEKMGETHDGGIADAVFQSLERQQTLISGVRPTPNGGLGA